MVQKGWTDHLSVFPSSIPIFLVGNKIDLRKSRTEEGTAEGTTEGMPEGMTEGGDDFVSEEEGREVANQRQWTFFETSALSNHNISELFSQISKTTLERIQNTSSPIVQIKKEG